MALFPKPQEKRSHLDNVTLQPRCQCRVELDKEHVGNLAEAYRDEREVPKIEVWEVDPDKEDGHGSTLVVVDGYHRRRALQLLEREFIQVLVVGSGSLDEAALYAATRNHEHGLRRLVADRELTVKKVLENPLAVGFTNLNISKLTGCNDKLVARVRKEVERAIKTTASAPAPHDDGDASADDAEPTKRVGADGKRYPAARPHRGRKAGKKKKEHDERLPDDEVFDDMLVSLKALRITARRVAREREELRTTFEFLAERLDAMQGHVAARRPVLCPMCGAKGCDRCSYRGWVTKERADQLKEEKARG